ncbi:hypothetical protein DFA_10384 [Cavenderia fasciculata]|uniref:Pesticidal crystal protein N-terminal domain-containing protein n=1 Tax=Cavenderia fasciculata TaxID=261658 RepID=F4QA23_CACFS|nr:uncharacterized protein DFA_10384 [Cavenderia fasciculata]EGG15542.1 hypothetical protein DFA_10384 [Cavenderia fasciculata]|eukprot:XP_004354284.1 hypothetical protein DFA_10384 [Cavenderia fasciculata]
MKRVESFAEMVDKVLVRAVNDLAIAGSRFLRDKKTDELQLIIDKGPQLLKLNQLMYPVQLIEHPEKIRPLNTSFEDRNASQTPVNIPNISKPYIYHFDGAFFYPMIGSDYMKGKRDIPNYIEPFSGCTGVYNQGGSKLPIKLPAKRWVQLRIYGIFYKKMTSLNINHVPLEYKLDVPMKCVDLATEDGQSEAGLIYTKKMYTNEILVAFGLCRDNVRREKILFVELIVADASEPAGPETSGLTTSLGLRSGPSMSAGPPRGYPPPMPMYIKSLNARAAALPMFVQFTNMYLGFILDQIADFHNFNYTLVQKNKLRVELSEWAAIANTDVREIYSNYTATFNNDARLEADEFNQIAQYISMTGLAVHDQAYFWEYLDPIAYPYGAPPIRTINSPLVGADILHSDTIYGTSSTSMCYHPKLNNYSNGRDYLYPSLDTSTMTMTIYFTNRSPRSSNPYTQWRIDYRNSNFVTMGLQVNTDGACIYGINAAGARNSAYCLDGSSNEDEGETEVVYRSATGAVIWGRFKVSELYRNQAMYPDEIAKNYLGSPFFLASFEPTSYSLKDIKANTIITQSPACKQRCRKGWLNNGVFQIIYATSSSDCGPGQWDAFNIGYVKPNRGYRFIMVASMPQMVLVDYNGYYLEGTSYSTV